ncbi:MAG: cobalamin-dependent protein [Thermodesulfovibrionia bacterium]|nr:cobalamin-dependent protein [Thermodesulfovibrionia bacterium]
MIEGLQIQTPAPPIGLAYIGAYLKKNGHEYTAIDACGEALDQIFPSKTSNQILIQGLTIPQILESVPENSKIIGFSCSFSHCWPLTVEIAKAVRDKFPNALLVAGGEHPTALPEYVLKDGIIDVVVMREGEETFLDLVNIVNNNDSWHKVDGIAYMDAEQKFICNMLRKRIVDIDKFPYPDWDNWCIEKYIEHQQVSGINLGKSMPILGSRGCPYMCTFCSNECMWTRRYIMRDGKALVDEMEYMKNKYNVSGFSFFDSTFIVKRSKTLEFCKELIERNLNVSYQLPAGTRCEVFDDELAAALEKSGLRNFSFAVESGSETIRNIIKKQIKLNDLFKAIKSVRKTKMTVGCFIVIGFPEDNKKTMKQTLSLIRKIAFMGIDDVTVSKFTPYPCSEYFNQLQEKGFLGDKLDELNNVISFFSKEGLSYCEELSAKETYRWMNWLYINFYMTSFIVRPWKLVRNFWNYFSKGIETTRYMRFFSEIFYNRSKWKKHSI